MRWHFMLWNKILHTAVFWKQPFQSAHGSLCKALLLPNHGSKQRNINYRNIRENMHIHSSPLWDTYQNSKVLCTASIQSYHSLILIYSLILRLFSCQISQLSKWVLNYMLWFMTLWRKIFLESLFQKCNPVSTTNLLKPLVFSSREQTPSWRVQYDVLN